MAAGGSVIASVEGLACGAVACRHLAPHSLLEEILGQETPPPFRASNAMMANPIPNPAKTEASDAALIARALARDAVALAEIMRQNNRRLYRAAWGILRDEQEAE